MPADFFTTTCQETTSDIKFGICDDDDELKAYIDSHYPNNWIAIIKNTPQHEITFIAVDNCLDLRRLNGEPDNKCDGILYYNDTIIFIELKDKNRQIGKWIDNAINQIRRTIYHFQLQEPKTIQQFINQKAYIANKARPYFQISQKHRMNNFYQETGVILRIEASIIIE